MEYTSHKKSFIMLEEQNKTFALDKSKPIRGYLKLETGANKGAIRAGVENLRYFERGGYVYKLILFGKRNEKTIYKILGNLLISNRGRGETYLKLNPVNVDGNGNGLEYFAIGIIVAVSTSNTQEPLHPILRGSLAVKEQMACKKEVVTYNNYYNQYILQGCKAIENKKELYHEILPFREDSIKAKWKRIVNLSKFPIVSPGSQKGLSRYRHFIFGVGENHYFIGVPGRFLKEEQPDEGASGFILWQPIIGAEGYGADREGASVKARQVAYGYWIAAVNNQSGSIEAFTK